VTFAELQESHQNFIASHVLGELIEYLPYAGSGKWLTDVPAKVRRAPIDSLEGVIKGSLTVSVSKAYVPIVHRRRDYLRLPVDKDKAELEPPRYKVQDAVELPGGWRLICEKVR